MPKIDEVLNNDNLLPGLQRMMVDYLNNHDDEVFCFRDAPELCKLIDHRGSAKSVAFYLWVLSHHGHIDKMRVGRRVYFGSKKAISELKERKNKITHD